MERAALGVVGWLTLALAGCGEEGGSITPTRAAETARVALASAPGAPGLAGTGITWRRGEVDLALAAARSSGRPVLLYWGAQWCPPCHQLQATVFSRPDFIAKSRLFVAVYLDGDDPGAQKWAERFRVTTYPTAVVLRPDGSEIVRVAEGMDLGRYAALLDLALGEVRPLSELLTRLATRGASLTAEECRQLAYNGWLLDETAMSELERTAELLWRAEAACPPTEQVERARLTAVAAAATTRSEEQQGRAPPSPGARVAVRRVRALLADRERALLAGDAFQHYLSDAFFMVARRVDPAGVDGLRREWIALMDAVAASPRFPEPDRLAAVARKLDGVRALDADGRIPPELAAAARQRAESALARRHDEETRAAVLSSVLFVLQATGAEQRAREVLVAELERAVAPYYFMTSLAALEERRGAAPAALDWLERAYRETASAGPATRFQWGTSYLLGLLRLRPDDEPRIRAVGLEVLGHLDGPDRLYQRSSARLERLDAALRHWNADGTRDATLAALRRRMEPICRDVAEAQAHRRCVGFLAPAS